MLVFKRYKKCDKAYHSKKKKNTDKIQTCEIEFHSTVKA